MMKRVPRFLTNLILAFLLSALFLSSFPICRVEGTSGSFTLYGFADSFTYDANPDSNYGSNLNLAYGLDGSSQIAYSWFHFNMSEAYDIYGDVNFTSAKVYIYHYALFTSGDGQCRSIDPANESWGESTITWNNQPTNYSYTEGADVDISNQGQYYYWNLLSTAQGGTSTKGLPALQDAYDNQRNKTYILQEDPSVTCYAGVKSRDADVSQRPKLFIEYTTEGGEAEEGEDPYIPNPKYFTLTYYPEADAQVNSVTPTTNYGTQNVSQIQWSSQEGTTLYSFFKFNFATPDLIDGNPNTEETELQPVFDAISIKFFQLCQFVPESPSPPDYVDWRGYYGVSAIDREDEGWSETGITWANQPALNPIVNRRYIDKGAWYSYTLADLEYSIRVSVEDAETYTINHRVDTSREEDSFSDWRMREYDGFVPYVVMEVAVQEDLGIDLSILGFRTAHYWLARSLMVTPFIAGHLLSAIVYAIIIIPIQFISRKLTLTLFLSMALLIMFLSFGWLNTGVFVFMFILTVLTLGVKLKKWLS